ncbi:MAG: mechanosensitive ion channel family protein [Sulfurovum sp.]|nr:mechanosensitive ion channel family protein [Sulfurovum sp.]
MLSKENILPSTAKTCILYFILFLFILLAIGMLNLSESMNFIISAIIKSILLLSFVGFLLQIIRTLLHKMANASSKNTDEEVVHVVQESTLPLFEITALIAFYTVVLYLVFSIWNVDMTALLAGAGIGAMAVGMAAKDTLSDIIAGILILTDAPYRVGDVVYVKGNLKGRVSAIGLRNTRLVTKNNIEVIVPNTIMGTSQIVNESSSKEFGIRIQLDVSVAFGEDVEAIKSLLINSANKAKKVAQDKEIKALMIGFEQYALGFRLQCWIANPEDKGSAKGELMELIYLNFYEAGIDIAMTREQNINMVHEQLPPQEIRITQFPETSSNVHVKEFPDTKQEMHIKEVPNLFATGKIKKMTKVTKVKDGDEK